MVGAPPKCPHPPFLLETSPLELLILSSVRLSLSWRIKLTFFDNLPNTTIFAFFKLLQCYNESKKLNLLISIHTLLFHEMWILFRCPLPNLFSFTKCHYIGSHTFLFSNLLNSNPFHKCPSILIFEEEDISTHRSGVRKTMFSSNHQMLLKSNQLETTARPLVVVLFWLFFGWLFSNGCSPMVVLQWLFSGPWWLFSG